MADKANEDSESSQKQTSVLFSFSFIPKNLLGIIQKKSQQTTKMERVSGRRDAISIQKHVGLFIEP